MTFKPRTHAAFALIVALGLLAIATSARSPSPAPPVQAAYVDAAGVRLRYACTGTRGAAPTVVLVHGFGESLVAWRGVASRLAESHAVCALDLPGFGLSDKPASGYATDTMAARVWAALDRIAPGRVVLAGHSLGGAVAAAAAATHPERTAGLVLVDAALVGQPRALPGGESAGAGEGVRRAIAEYEAMRTRFTSPHDRHWLGESDSALRYLPGRDPAYRTALAAVLREFDFGWLTPERAARLTMPTLLIWGAYDPVFPEAAGKALQGRIAGAEMQVIDRAWHRPHEERPDEVAAAIDDFLRKKGGGTPETH